MATPSRSSRAPVGGERHVALLRAINVGGRNKLSMKDLVDVFVEAGCENVRTYIQSGNVVFEAKARVLAALPRAIPAVISSRFGLDVPLVLRSASELRAAVAANPFAGPSTDPNSLYLAFLRDAPQKKRVAGLDPDRSPGDTFVVRGREIYLRLGTGAANTKLTVAWFDAQLETVATVRNWRTAEALVELAEMR
jgi:uncharacterized protein (DUF1697 family)